MAIYKKAQETFTKPTSGGQYILVNVSMERELSSIITGRVIDNENNPVANAGVVLVELDSTANTKTDMATAFTDNDGRFGFPFKVNSDDSNISYQLEIFAPNTIV